MGQNLGTLPRPEHPAAVPVRAPVSERMQHGVQQWLGHGQVMHSQVQPQDAARM